jgi:hypothetical protein
MQRRKKIQRGRDVKTAPSKYERVSLWREVVEARSSLRSDVQDDGCKMMGASLARVR